MLKKITQDNIADIANPVFRANAQVYLDIEADFKRQIESFGLAASTRSPISPSDPLIDRLISRGLTAANDRKSLHKGWISPSCVSCRTGVGSITCSISMQCPRDCFFCFNPNQDNYERLQCEIDDPSISLREMHAKGARFKDIALTGGEPLLHKVETERFFRTAQELYPDAHTRLYTSGAYLDEAYLRLLAGIGLNEIRFSIKTDDPPQVLEGILQLVALARKHLEYVVVEMPVMPDELDLMKDLLIRLDALGIDAINLLELCFPFNNADEFNRRGYKLKSEQFRVLYNYWYSGGLPIDGSEETCLRLLEFAFERDLSMGVHYCSLENKFSGQVFQQNVPYQEDFAFCTLSQRDYFLKSAKVFGNDVEPIKRLLNKQGLKRYHRDGVAQSLEFPPTYLQRLANVFPDMQVALSYHIVESDGGESFLRELRLDLVSPASFDPSTDL